MFLVFDLTIRKSLENLISWFKEASECGYKDMPTYLIGNKVWILKKILLQYKNLQKIIN
jgi:GTPase SAR1 family protein